VSLLGPAEQEAIRSLFEGLEKDVVLDLVLGPEATSVTVLAGGRELDFGGETQALLESVSALSGQLTLSVKEAEDPGRYPTLAIGERLHYDGLPWGHELATLVYGIAEAGKAEPSLSASSVAALDSLERDVAIEVYVTPT
jgi:alkyl hydroperoxide reductase subunit AhpF